MTSQNSNPSPQPKNLFHPALWSFAGNEEVRLRSRKSKRAHPKTAPCTAQRSKRCIMRASKLFVKQQIIRAGFHLQYDRRRRMKDDTVPVAPRNFNHT